MKINEVFEIISHNQVLSSSAWLLICAGIFTTLQNIFPHDATQPKLRKDTYIDVFYWIVVPVIYSAISLAFISAGFWLIFQGDAAKIADYSLNGAQWAKGLPLWLLAGLSLLFTDFCLYWTHRWFHTGKFWDFHAIHHAALEMDWMTSVRFHPVNILCHTILVNALALWIGFPPAALAVLVPFNILYSCMVHANLNWTFGPLKYVFASPVFHRWHHTGPDEGGNLNFAPTFTFIDLMFGTFYMPEGKLPGKTGLFEAQYVPATLVGQFVFPFVGTKKEETKIIAAE